MLLSIKDFTEEDMAKLFPDLPKEHRKESAYRFTQYLRIVAHIFERMEAEGKIPKSLVRKVEKRRKRLKRKGKL